MRWRCSASISVRVEPVSAPVFDGPGLPPEDLDPRFAAEWEALIERLYVRARGGMVLGLERMHDVLRELDRPERSLPAVHVAGSNGKGSTAAFLGFILSQPEGERVGLYTSPHLSCLSERFQLISNRGNRSLERGFLLEVFGRIEALAPDYSGLTFFEIVTAAGLLAFAESEVSALVAEAGLGARLDATRVTDARVSVLTQIDLEHCAILGDTLELIAAEKAFVARPERPLFMEAARPSVLEVVKRHARGIDAPVFVAGRDFRSEPQGSSSKHIFCLLERTIDGIELGLRGPHQVRNALLAAQAALAFRPSLTDDEIRRGLYSVTWPGRFEILERPGEPTIVLDGAHNPDGVRTLRVALRGEAALVGRSMHWLSGVLEDKEPSEMFGALCDLATSMTLCTPPTPRALPSEVLMRSLPSGFAGPVEALGPPWEAMDAALSRARADRGFVLVAGSLYLVGALRPRLLRLGWRVRA